MEIVGDSTFYGAESMKNLTFAPGSAVTKLGSYVSHQLRPPAHTVSSNRTNLNCILPCRRVAVLMVILLARLFLLRRFTPADLSR